MFMAGGHPPDAEGQDALQSAAMRLGPYARLDRPLLGDGVRVRDAAAMVVRRPSRVADPAPNAPLLMRIVRHPYALATGRPRRVVYKEDPEAFVAVDATDQRHAASEERVHAPFVNPVGRRLHLFTLRPSRAVALPVDPAADPLRAGDS